MGRKIKAMGTSDVRKVNKGDTAGGQLDPLSVDLRWDRGNNWIVDSDDHPEVSDEWWDFLAGIDTAEGSEGFKDVSDLKRIPLNAHQKMFLGMSGSDPRAVATDEAVAAAVAGAEKTDDAAEASGKGDTSKATGKKK